MTRLRVDACSGACLRRALFRCARACRRSVSVCVGVLLWAFIALGGASSAARVILTLVRLGEFARFGVRRGEHHRFSTKAVGGAVAMCAIRLHGCGRGHDRRRLMLGGLAWHGLSRFPSRLPG